MTLVADDVIVDGQRLEARWWRPALAAHPTPIVLLHEGLGSVSAWREFPDRLANATGRAVFAYSRLGYGQSPPLTTPFGLDFMEREARIVLPQVLDAVGVSTAVLVGHSDGGSIALLAAAAQRARVTAVVTLAAHVFVEEVTIASIAALRARYPASDLPMRMARHHRHADALVDAWTAVWLAPGFQTWNIEAALGDVRVPVLALQGLDDEYGTPSQVSAIARGVAGPVQTTLIQKCGHSPHRDQPDGVLERIRTFLTENA